MVILDTTILIHLLRGDSKAGQKIAELESRFEKVYTTQINVFEIMQGIYANGKRIDEEIAALEMMLERIILLDLNYFSAYQAGRLSGNLGKKGISVASSDVLIAGIALANNIDLIVTKNEKDFSRIPGIKLENY